ncbi:MAG: RsmF rRNA methyltransferase first C-terminal domain-containing protein [Bacilli bacterium]|nr:RsmF rRNA methyltransferase first C-terminal domain-containing protein [Bacilli bacterium]
MKDQFLKRMQLYLQDEYDDYLKTLNEHAYRGIRVNLLKEDKPLLESTFSLIPSKFCKDGYYSDGSISGNHPYHLQGLFYMQEPSASGVVSVLDVQKNDWVLDLCAAPGGKSTQIASALMHTGFLVSNELIANRAQILLSNLERMGVSENMITNTSVEILCDEMMGCFDKVVVDAPCSGEGMFKIHEKAMEDWSEEHVASCATRQLMILNEAYKALKQNGILVYSTCTYAMEENEQVIYTFLKAHPDMELVDCDVDFGRSGIAYLDLDVSKVRRIFPMDQGEGHFIAKMKRVSENTKRKLEEIKNKKIDECVDVFMKDQLSKQPLYFYHQNGKVYAKNTPFIKLKKTKILRQGILCGEIIKQRFEPHHHFYMASCLDANRKKVISINEKECAIFLSGNVLNIPCEKGYTALSYHNHILGYGKSDGKQIKNKFPKGLRVNSY